MLDDILKITLKDIKTVKRELSHASLDAFQMKHSYVQPGYRL